MKLEIPQNKKSLTLLVDPDKTYKKDELSMLGVLAGKLGVSFIFVGGSLVSNNYLDSVIEYLKQNFQGPVVLFPGGLNQLSPQADGILFLSLISGRNPEYLIGKQVTAAPLVREMNLEVIPVGYMLIGDASSASYISNTQPIPFEKNDIAMATSLAGQMLGHKAIYLDAGSGAERLVHESMVEAVKSVITVPLIVGGGIRTFDDAYTALEAGADMLVVGNAVEKDTSVLQEIAGAIKTINSLNVHK